MLVLDQDLLQEIWGILYLRPMLEASELVRLLEALLEDLPDAIVYIKVDGQKALARMGERRDLVGPIGDFDRGVGLDAKTLDRSATDFTRIIEIAATVRGSLIIELDGCLSPEIQSAIVVASLEAISP